MPWQEHKIKRMCQDIYQGIVKFYSPGDDIGSLLRNLETILNDETIPEELYRAFILCKNLSSFTLKIIESVPDHQLNDYKYLKEWIC